MIRRFLVRLLLSIFLVGFPLSALATESYEEYQLKAAITYNIARFVIWPDGTFADAEAPLVVCVLGDGKTVDGFSSLEGKLLGRRPIQVKYLQSQKDCRDGHVLYVARSQSHDMNSLLAKLNNAPILTLSDMENFSARGGMITLVNVDNNIRFAINLEAATAADLQLSSKLYSLATEVIREGP